MVSIRLPLVKNLAHVHLEESHIAGIYGLSPICASGRQTQLKCVALLHQHALELACGLVVQLVNEQESCSSGYLSSSRALLELYMGIFLFL